MLYPFVQQMWVGVCDPPKDEKQRESPVQFEFGFVMIRRRLSKSQEKVSQVVLVFDFHLLYLVSILLYADIVPISAPPCGATPGDNFR